MDWTFSYKTTFCKGCSLANTCRFYSESSAVTVPYLPLQQLGSEIKWVDGGKPLFRLSTHLVSTVYTQVCTPLVYYCPCPSTLNAPWQMKIKFEMTRLLQDQHLHNFFQHCQNMEMSEQASEGELVKYLKVLKATFIWIALRKSQHALLFMSYQIIEHRAQVLHTFLCPFFCPLNCQQICPAASWALLGCFGCNICKHLTESVEIMEFYFLLRAFMPWRVMWWSIFCPPSSTSYSVS